MTCHLDRLTSCELFNLLKIAVRRWDTEAQNEIRAELRHRQLETTLTVSDRPAIGKYTHICVMVFEPIGDGRGHVCFLQRYSLWESLMDDFPLFDYGQPLLVEVSGIISGCIR